MVAPCGRVRLEAAYRATAYCAETPHGCLVLRVGQLCPELDALLGNDEARKWAFLTAHNPGSRLLPPAENQQRHAELKRRLDDLPYRYYPGKGLGDLGDWPGEESFLAMDLGEAEAITLARQFEQAAIVVGELGSPARLLWIGSADDSTNDPCQATSGNPGL